MASVPVWPPSADVASSRHAAPRAVSASRYSNCTLQQGADCPAADVVGAGPLASTTDQSFGRDIRLLKPAEYKRVFDSAVRVTSRYLTFLARANELGHPRLGLAISKKAVRRAVDRNRIKRQLRESFRLHQHELGGIDIVVMARAGNKEWDWHEMQTSLDTKWRELRKRCKGS